MMSREDAHKLLGGYATGTLTPEEQQALFEAALQDQELFDALAREQALSDVLGDPAARAHLLAAIDDVPAPWYRKLWRPIPAAVLAAALAVVAIVAVRQGMRPPQPLPLARLEFPPQPQPVLPPPPEIATAAPVERRLTLPAATPAPPAPLSSPAPSSPPPVAEVSLTKDKKEDAAVAVAAAAPLVDAPRQLPPNVQFGALPAGRAAAPFGANAFLGSGTVPVTGTVRDRTGAAIPSANVEVRSLATGATANVSTNERGEFRADEPPGQTYELKATAPGFRVKTASVPPTAGLPAPVNFQLEVGAATETVEVTAGALQSAMAGQAGGGGRGGSGVRAGVVTGPANAAKQQDAAAQATLQQAQQAPATQSQQDAAVSGGALAVTGFVQVPTLVFQPMQRMPDGSLVAIPANGSVPVGATVVLQVTPPDDGQVQIKQGSKTLANQPVHAMQRSEIKLPLFTKKQHVDLDLIFTGPPIPGSTTTEAVRARAAKPQMIATHFTVSFTVR